MAGAGKVNGEKLKKSLKTLLKTVTRQKRKVVERRQKVRNEKVREEEGD